MLSILIPTKDYDCSLLIEELHKQGKALGLPFEILVGEDGTAMHNLQKNITADELPCCRRIIRQKNIGRANIRNQLAVEAKHPYILFIDSDAIVETPNFLANYIAALKHFNVVCGGLYHTQENNDKSQSLRFKYEKKADKKRNAATRNKRPYSEFTTFNFAIERELFLSIFFNTKIIRYGYEDTLFGKELERRNIKVLHIDNKLLHNGIESNELFLEKTRQALETLATIETIVGNTPLLNTTNKLHRWHLTWIFSLFWKLLQRPIIRNLLGENPSLTLFNIYKLGTFLEIKRSPAGNKYPPAE